MIRECAKDKYGNEIYITEERWQHVLERHPEMSDCYQMLLKTIRTGKRKRRKREPSKFTYTRKFKNLSKGNAIVAIVKFSFKIVTDKEIQHNYLLTAYQKFIK